METLVEVELPRDRTCAGVARRTVEERTVPLAAEIVDDVKTVVSELVDNAYLHGRGRIWLRLRRSCARLRVEVTDEGEGAVLAINPQPSSEGGYGLQIVASLSRAWGAYEGTTHVWAELELPGR
jgi:anti-sigma regulatory factor (Ser/Thr protein kinase)